MSSLPFGHGDHPALVQIDRQTTRAAQHVAVSFYPAWAAWARQPARGNDNIAALASRCESAFGHWIHAPREQQVPGLPRSRKFDRAIVAVAARTRPIGQCQRLAVHTGKLVEVIARIARATFAKNQQAVLRLAGDPGVAAIARNQQVGRAQQK